MRAARAAVIVSICLAGATSFAQDLELSGRQRDLLRGLIAATDRAGAAPAAADDWLIHVLRASDGSHYVAASVTPTAVPLPAGDVVVYVRLATRTSGANPIAQRSVVSEWLRGVRVDPRLLPQRRGIAIGDMPVMGAGSIGARATSSVGSTDLQLMQLERDRARERRDSEKRQRREALESGDAGQSPVFPFEDFAIGAAAAFADGTRAIQRALTAGPGSYDLLIAWVDAGAAPQKAEYHVARRSLQLAPAAAEFGLSSVIVADHINVRGAPYSPIEQRAHPYAIGLTEVVAARDTVFTPAEQLAVAFQIINAAPSPSGTPDVHVNLRIVRAGSRDQVVAMLSPLTYDASTLPPDFDVRLGHPVIAALAAPLATIPRGDYQLLITAEDRIAGSVVGAAAEFTVVGTPATLLAEAPPLGGRFETDTVLDSGALATLVDGLTRNPSPALARALQLARERRFADLLVEDAVAPGERGIRAALAGIGLLSLGNPGATAEFQRALRLGAPEGPVQFLIGAAYARQHRDADAIAAWRAARAAGLSPPLIDPLLANAYLRQKDYARAAAAFAVRPSAADTAALRSYAATRIATGRFNDAASALDELLAASAGDHHARWLLLHALYADFAGGNRAVAPRLATEAQRYIERQGTHAALAAEWLKMITSS